MAGRIPIVFVEQVPWGGGAERAVYSLAARLDLAKFSPFIVHLFDQTEQIMPFESVVPLICVKTDPPPVLDSEGSLLEGAFVEQGTHAVPVEIPLQKSSGLLSWLHHLYRGLSPELRTRLRMGEILQTISRRFQNRTPYEEAMADRNDMGRLNVILSAFPQEAVFVAVMEEASIQLWLNQAYQQRRWVAWLHTIESHFLPILYPHLERLAVEEWLLANASRNAETVVFPSQGCKEDLCEQFFVHPEHIRVIPNPLDIEAIIRQSKENPSLDLPKRTTMFVQVGRFQQEKNHRLLIEACQLLRRQEEDFVVICLGDGPLRAGIQALVDEYGLSEHVLLPGAVANPYPFMAAARAAILTSDFESFALVLVEAMACGAVPVSVDCPVGPREVLNGGDYGMLTPPDDPQALADAMLKIAYDDELYARLSALGLERARIYDIDPITRQWETLLLGTALQRKEEK
jgi:glycosyltransferase involved in cell wall biosynthesis